MILFLFENDVLNCQDSPTVKEGVANVFGEKEEDGQIAHLFRRGRNHAFCVGQGHCTKNQCQPDERSGVGFVASSRCRQGGANNAQWQKEWTLEYGVGIENPR